MSLFPIYGVFEGEFIPHLVAIDTDNSMAEVAEAIAHHSVGRRIPPRPESKGYIARIDNQVVDLERPFGDVMADLDIQPLDFVTVGFA